MSSITPAASPIAPLTTPTVTGDPGIQGNGKPVVAETQQTTVNSQSYVPAWLQTVAASSANSLEALGLRSPRAVGDLATMLAQASLNLELSIDESTSKSVVAKAAGILGFLSSFNAQAFEERVDKTTATADRTNATQAAFQSDHNNTVYYRDRAPNQPERDRLNYELLGNRKENADREIADLRVELALAVPNSAEAQAINTAIQAKEALKTRVDGDIGYFRNELSYYSSEVSRFQGYINAELAKPEKDRNNGAISGWTATRDYNSQMLGQRRGELESHANSTVASDMQQLGTKLTSQRAEQGVAVAALQSITIALLFATVSAALTAARDRASTGNDTIAEAGRDLAINDEFEEIMEALKGKSDDTLRLLIEELDIQPVDDKVVSLKDERVKQIALGLLASITSFVSSTAQIEPLELPSPAQQESGSRLRFAV